MSQAKRSAQQIGLTALLSMIGCEEKGPQYHDHYDRQEQTRQIPAIPPHCLATSSNQDNKPNRSKPGEIKIFYQRDGSALSTQDKQDLESFLSTLPPNQPLTITGSSDRWGNASFNQRIATQRAKCAQAYILNSFATKDQPYPSILIRYELTRGTGLEHMTATLSFQVPHQQGEQAKYQSQRNTNPKPSPTIKREKPKPSPTLGALEDITTPSKYEHFLRARGIHHFGDDPSTPENDERYNRAHNRLYGPPAQTIKERGGVCDELAVLSATAARNFRDTRRVEIIEVAQNGIRHAFTIRQTSDNQWYFMNNTHINKTPYNNRKDAIFEAARDTGYIPEQQNFQYRTIRSINK